MKAIWCTFLPSPIPRFFRPFHACVVGGLWKLMVGWMTDQEWVVYRAMRRLLCLDDFKPNPPWGEMENKWLMGHYNTSAETQWIYDYVV
jgi:hypothetical protein